MMRLRFDEFLSDLFVFDPVIRRARRKSRSGDPDGAIRDLKAVLARKRPSPRRLNALAWLLLKNGQADEALEYCDRALATAPRHTGYMATRGRALRRLKRFDEALPLVLARYRRHKWDILNTSELCKLLVDMGRTTEAIPIFRAMEKRFGSIARKTRAMRLAATHEFLQTKEKLSKTGKLTY